MTMKKEILDIRPVEFIFAKTPIDCEICGITIAIGSPYKVTRTLHAVNGVYEIHVVVECLKPCSMTKTTVIVDSEEVKQPGFTVHHSWTDMPEFGGEAQAKLRIISLRGGEWLATGYSHIREWTSSEKANGFVVFNGEQVQKKIFARDFENDDVRGFYEAWKTPGGMWVRKYIKPAMGIQIGQWTMQLNLLAIAKASESAKKANA
jgi:hypothetical protein